MPVWPSWGQIVRANSSAEVAVRVLLGAVGAEAVRSHGSFQINHLCLAVSKLSHQFSEAEGSGMEQLLVAPLFVFVLSRPAVAEWSGLERRKSW